VPSSSMAWRRLPWPWAAFPHAGVLPHSQRCKFSPSLSLWSLVQPPLNCRCSLSLPWMLHWHSWLCRSVLPLWLALGRMGIRVSVLPRWWFWSSSAVGFQLMLHINRVAGDKGGGTRAVNRLTKFQPKLSRSLSFFNDFSVMCHAS
jgi:hypothetical protein